MDGLATVFAASGVFLWFFLFMAVAGLAIWLFMLQLRISRTRRHYSLLMRNVNAGNLEQILDQHLSQLYDTAARVEDLTAFCQELDQTLRHAIQRVGVVRYNPFDDTGGDQSFSIALLDSAGNGIVISSLFSRAGNRIYAKSIQDGRSKYPLTAEEEQAIQQAVSIGAASRS